MSESVFKDSLFDGKIALVTGGATGIGAEMAYQLASHGAQVIIASRKADKIAAAAAGLTQMTGRTVECLALLCDVSNSCGASGTNALNVVQCIFNAVGGVIGASQHNDIFCSTRYEEFILVNKAHITSIKPTVHDGLDVSI